VDLLVFGRLAIATLNAFEGHRLHVNLVGDQLNEDFDHALPAIDLFTVHANHHAYKRENVILSHSSQQFANRSARVEFSPLIYAIGSERKKFLNKIFGISLMMNLSLLFFLISTRISIFVRYAISKKFP
jgi:hypothetical protein